MPVGAASQWFTTALVMLAVQEGTLTLNDKVSDYLPLFTKHGKGHITIGHCLTNNTGIQNDQGVGRIFQKNKYHLLEEEVNDYAAKREIETNPGTESDYSNIGFNIAARVLEVITKKPYDRLTQEKLFRPLAMRNTTFANEDYNDGINASTGARSTPADFMNFLNMLLNKGTYNGRPFLTETSVDAMFSQTELASKVKNLPKMLEGSNYALGNWILEKKADGKPNAYTSPSLGGMWPVIDLCRNYAFVLFAKEAAPEQRKAFVMNLKAVIDEKVQANCR